MCYAHSLLGFFFFFFKQKTAYEIYQCDWSSDVCSSDLLEWRVKLEKKPHVLHPFQIDEIVREVRRRLGKDQ